MEEVEDDIFQWQQTLNKVDQSLDVQTMSMNRMLEKSQLVRSRMYQVGTSILLNDFGASRRESSLRQNILQRKCDSLDHVLNSKILLEMCDMHMDWLRKEETWLRQTDMNVFTQKRKDMRHIEEYEAQWIKERNKAQDDCRRFEQELVKMWLNLEVEFEKLSSALSKQVQDSSTSILTTTDLKVQSDFLLNHLKEVMEETMKLGHEVVHILNEPTHVNSAFRQYIQSKIDELQLTKKKEEMLNLLKAEQKILTWKNERSIQEKEALESLAQICLGPELKPKKEKSCLVKPENIIAEHLGLNLIFEDLLNAVVS